MGLGQAMMRVTTNLHGKLVTLTGDEYDQYWSRLAESDKRWDQYQARTKRKIPLIHLEPR